MNSICLDQQWTYRKGLLDSPGILKADPGTEVNRRNGRRAASGCRSTEP